jgi:cytidylate kinase
VDKAAIEKHFVSYGFSEKKLEKFDERKPGFWASLSQDRDDYLHYLKTAMYHEALDGDAVFIGRGSFAIFHELPATISILLVAPLPIRVERVKSYFRCDDKRARQIIEQSDHNRAGFHRYFFDLDWEKPANYHFVLNMGILHPAAAAELVFEATRLMITAEAEEKSRVRLHDLSVAQNVVGCVIYEKKVPIHFLEAEASSGDIILHGVANSQALIENAVAAARGIDGVRSVRSEIQVVQEYTVMP